MSTMPTHEQIAVLAFERYASRGYQNGHDLDDWYWAECSLLAQTSNTAAAPAPSPSPTPAPEHSHHQHGHHEHGHHEHHQHGAHDTHHH